jgi:hypothetical protein
METLCGWSFSPHRPSEVMAAAASDNISTGIVGVFTRKK